MSKEKITKEEYEKAQNIVWDYEEQLEKDAAKSKLTKV